MLSHHGLKGCVVSAAECLTMMLYYSYSVGEKGGTRHMGIAASDIMSEVAVTVVMSVT